MCNTPFNRGEALPSPEANLNIVIPKHNLFNRYFHNLRYYVVPKELGMSRTYEDASTYYQVWKPLNKHVDCEDDLKKIEKHCRNTYKYERIFITREIVSARVHYNVIVTTKVPVNINQTFKKGFSFRLCTQPLNGLQDLERVVTYTLKESMNREFKRGIDYFVYKK